MKGSENEIPIVACNTAPTEWIKCQFNFKIDAPSQSELPDVLLLITLSLKIKGLERLLYLQYLPNYYVSKNEFIASGISGKKKLQCLNNFEVGIEIHVFEMDNFKNYKSSILFQVVITNPAEKVYKHCISFPSQPPLCGSN